MIIISKHLSFTEEKRMFGNVKLSIPKKKTEVQQKVTISFLGTYVDHEDIFTIKDVNNVKLSKQKRLEAAATAYINYFSYLGTTDDTGKIDFRFVENLLKSTGMLATFITI